MHPLNVTHLVIGLVLLGLSGLWAADLAGWITDYTYVMPLLLVAAGAIGLLAFALRGSFHPEREHPEGRARDNQEEEITS